MAVFERRDRHPLAIASMDVASDDPVKMDAFPQFNEAKMGQQKTNRTFYSLEGLY